LVLAANRDEFYERPTQEAHWWKTEPPILAGKDLKMGGTWIGITKAGKWAAVTNYRQFPVKEEHQSSRGSLVTDYLNNEIDEVSYLNKLEEKANNFDGYNLLFGDMDMLYWYSNKNPRSRPTARSRGTAPLVPGIYGLSNHLLDSPWPKVENGKAKLKEILDEGEKINPNSLFSRMKDNTAYPDDKLPETGVGIEFERVLSPAFIKTDVYGSRSTTVLLINNDNEVYFEERSYVPEALNKFEFSIKAT